MAKTSDLDLYGILELTPECTEKEIVKAYRKKALKYHPDKNPDNPKAADLFHDITKALGILTDAAAKAAYDKALKAKKAAELRHKQLDGKRKKLKEDLDSKEKAAQQKKEDDVNLEAAIERLRKEGSKLVEEEQDRLAEELKKDAKLAEEQKKDAKQAEELKKAAKESAEQTEAITPRLKVRWKAKKGDPENGGYSESLLMSAFNKYGDVSALIVSMKRKGSAIVEFISSHSAVLAIQHEVGLANNPLTVSWLSGEPADSAESSTTAEQQQQQEQELRHKSDGADHTFYSHQSDMAEDDLDFESLVLRRMRQAEERKQLIKQIEEDDT